MRLALPQVNKGCVDMKKLRITMSAGVATLYLEGEIGEWGWTPQLWDQKVAELREKGCTALQVRINSPGGSVVDALAICDCIEALKAEMRVEAVVCGLCASAATLIACVCDRVTITSNSTWMVHEPSCTLSGNTAELRAQMKAFDDARARVYAIYAAVTGKTPEQLAADHVSAVYYTAAEAEAYGFCALEGGEKDAEEDEEPTGEGEQAEEAAAEEGEEPTAQGEDAAEESTEEPEDGEEGAEGAAEDGDDAGEEDDEAADPEKASMFARFCAWMRREKPTGKRSPRGREAGNAAVERQMANLRAELAGARASLETALVSAEKSEAEFTARVNKAVAARMAAASAAVDTLPAAVDTLPRASMASVVEKEGLNGALALLAKMP